MNPVAAKQVALNNSLVSPEKRLKIEKCNARIEFSKPQGEETYQVTLDALKLSPCYLAFMIIAEPWRTFAAIINREDFLFKADNKEISFARKEHMPYLKFTKFIINYFIYKDKTISIRNMINLHTIHDDTLLDTLKFVSKTQDYQQYEALIPDDMINQDIKDSKAYKTYLDFATRKATPKKASKFKKVASPSRKLSSVLEEEARVKPKRAKRPVKKSTTVLTTSVVIRETPSESVTKKKTPPKVDRGKGKDLFSDVASLEAAQLKKTLKKSKLETHKLHASGLGDGVGSLPKFLDEQEDKQHGDSGDDDDSDKVTKDDDDDVDSDVDGDKEASDSEKTDSDEDENPNLNQNDDEEEDEEEYVRTPDSFEFTEDGEEYEELYKDVNVRLKEIEHEEKGKGDEEMIDNGHDDITQQTTYEQVKDDEHVILTTVHDTHKTEVPLQSLSVSSDFANQFLNLDNISPNDIEFVSMMNVKVRHEEPSTQTPPLLNIPVKVILKTSTVTRSTIPPTIPPITPLQ
uniref:Retrovirus-related Pol polyprotein from transposon TNT 1-94 n=1 Tax=Tanacetum cinerariifolium TaxID=118510 RepID=A0A699K2P3_TANCI|nr:hypothetical protein [Tanacetum cinerariifolium]